MDTCHTTNFKNCFSHLSLILEENNQLQLKGAINHCKMCNQNSIFGHLEKTKTYRAVYILPENIYSSKCVVQQLIHVCGAFLVQPRTLTQLTISGGQPSSPRRMFGSCGHLLHMSRDWESFSDSVARPARTISRVTPRVPVEAHALCAFPYIGVGGMRAL